MYGEFNTFHPIYVIISRQSRPALLTRDYISTILFRIFEAKVIKLSSHSNTWLLVFKYNTLEFYAFHIFCIITKLIFIFEVHKVDLMDHGFVGLQENSCLKAEQLGHQLRLYGTTTKLLFWVVQIAVPTDRVDLATICIHNSFSWKFYPENLEKPLNTPYVIYSLPLVYFLYSILPYLSNSSSHTYSVSISFSHLPIKQKSF